MHQFGVVADVDPVAADLHAGRDAQALCEYARLVGYTVAIEIAQGDDFVVRHYSGFDLWVDIGAGNKHASVRIPANRQRVSDAVPLVGEQVHFIPVEHLELGDLFADVRIA